MEAYGPQGWWPGETPFEVCAGAVLTQNTSWRNAARAVERLKEAGLLEAEALASCRSDRLQRLIRTAGYFRRKSRTLGTVARFLRDECGGDPRELARPPLAEARARLLALRGVGAETADSMLLYAADVPVFVIDAYTRRVAARHGLVSGNGSDDRLRELFEGGLPRDADVLGEVHALLVRVGKEWCHKREPACAGCPLEPLLPEGGAVEETSRAGAGRSRGARNQ
jgi:endonuclease-3 related protein